METDVYEYPPFLSGIWTERWQFVGVIDHPFYKKGPLLHWRGPNGTVMINRQLFYAEMTGTMEMEKHG